MTTEALDTAHSALVEDHFFNPPKGEWWGLCTKCGLGGATHKKWRKWVYMAREKSLQEKDFRCATCISKGEKVCPHQPR